MKYLGIAIIGFLSLSLTFVSAAEPSGVDILSQNYSASVSWNYEWDQVQNPLGIQRIQFYSSGSGTTNTISSDGTPVSVAMPPPVNPPGTGIPLNGGASIETFSYNAFALAGNDQDGFGSDGQYYETSGGNIQISTQASWLFQPINFNQQITLNVGAGGQYYENRLSVTLSDITDSATLFAYSESFGNYGAPIDTETFSLNLGDTYQLSMSGNEEVNAGDSEGQTFNASIVTVPEPRMFSLISTGLVGFFTSRKRLRIK